MLLLFGGLSDRFLAAYNEECPLDTAWRTRVLLWQLYPLAAHAVLFGGGYVRQLAVALTAVLSESQRVEDQLRIPIGRWLAANVKPHERVMLEPIGYIGYYSERRIIDDVGLVSPEVLSS